MIGNIGKKTKIFCQGSSLMEYVALTVAVIMGIVAMGKLFKSILLGHNRSAVISVFGEIVPHHGISGNPSSGKLNIK